MSWLSEKQNNIAQALKDAAFLSKEKNEINFTDLPNFVVEFPRDKSHGDFASNIAMVMAKAAKMAPRQIAETLLNNLDKNKAQIAKANIAGPGFINFIMPEDWLSSGLKSALIEGTNFGNSNLGQGEKVQVEFVSANPTGELHMGNARGGAVGDTLASVLKATGYNVTKEFYINDAGNQIYNFGLSLEARYLQQFGQDVPFPEDGYQGEDITKTVKELIAEVGDKYLDWEPKKRQQALIEYGLDKKLTAIKNDLKKYNIEYDVWFKESTLHESGAVLETINLLKKNGHCYESEGALWLKTTDFGEEKDEVLLRKNGIPTYYAADIAYHQNKFKRGFKTIVNIMGADHHGHVARLKAGVKALGYDADQVKFILMQLVRLFQDGEIMRMSKRAGTYITLDKLIDEVGVDAARYFFVMHSADSQMDFDLDLAKKQSSDNPVYYVQYAHARIYSLLNTIKEEGFDFYDLEQSDFALLKEESEKDLMHFILTLPDELALAAKNLEPHRLASYAHKLAALFHSFYTNCRVLGVEAPLMNARMWLAKATVQCLAKVLNIMGVSAPKKM